VRMKVSRLASPLTAAAVVFLIASDAEARPRSYGPSPAQIKKMQENAAYMQLEMVRYQTELARVHKEVARPFDTNGNNHLEGAEKSLYDKHMHAIETGKAPNPFATIAPPGKGPRPAKPIDELKRRGQSYQSQIMAKQREIFASFDRDSDGHLEGVERSLFDKHMRDIQAGRIPNPFAEINPLGQPATASKSSASKK